LSQDPEQLLRQVANNLDFLWSRWDGIMGTVIRNQQISERIYDAGDGTLVRINVTVANKPPHQRGRA
jgi:hypothetical protein